MKRVYQLEIVNISDPSNPTLLTGFSETHQSWTEIVYESKTLFSTELAFGFSVYDVSNPSEPELLASAEAERLWGISYYNDYIFVFNIFDYYTHIFHWKSATSEITRVGIFNKTIISSFTYENNIMVYANGTSGIEIIRLVITCCPTTSVKVGLNFGFVIILVIINFYFMSSLNYKRLLKHKRKKL